MEMEIKRSNRRTMSIQVTEDARVIVRAPLRMPEREIQRFLEEKSDWIEKSTEKVKQKKEERSGLDKLTRQDIERLAEQAVREMPKKVAKYAEEMGVTYGRITIRNQKSRWGSCSGKGNLNFNCLLMLAPEEVQDYVVVHELSHRKEMNHSVQFWNEVERVLPNYKSHKLWLKQHGGDLMVRMLH